SQEWWGTGKVIEFASFLPDLSVLYQLVTSVRQNICHWCGIELIGDRCVFCSATSPAAQATTGPSTTAATAAVNTSTTASPRYQHQLPAG
ncbi:hypothetical protein ACFW2N_30630, partial [Streptomyces sp. NPDC058855]